MFRWEKFRLIEQQIGWAVVVLCWVDLTLWKLT